jgi:hypothetical protein
MQYQIQFLTYNVRPVNVIVPLTRATVPPYGVPELKTTTTNQPVYATDESEMYINSEVNVVDLWSRMVQDWIRRQARIDDIVTDLDI